MWPGSGSGFQRARWEAERESGHGIGFDSLIEGRRLLANLSLGSLSVFGSKVDGDAAFADLDWVLRLTEACGRDHGVIAGVTEDLCVGDPVELAFIRLPRPDQIKGIPASQIVVSEMLQDDVLAAADEIGVPNRAVLADLVGDDVGAACFKGVVA